MLAKTVTVLLGSLALASAQTIPQWAQCGGIGWSGSGTCASGTVCTFVNDWYSQCLVGTTSKPPTSSSSPTTTSRPVTTSRGPVTTVTSRGPITTTSAPPPASTFPAGALTQMSNWGPNPNNILMYGYHPVGVVERPALLVALHWCSGTAQDYFGGTQYRWLADQKKSFVILYGSAVTSDKCWDVASNATLTHNGGGDSLGIASAVRYALANWNVDPTRVFVTGLSSGAMMTNVLLGAYPDLFAAGSAVAGVPYGCFSGPGSWNLECSQGRLIKTPQQWGDDVRRAYPGYTGPRPRVQLWHGTADDALFYQNFLEEIKQWTNVHGVSLTSTTPDTPLPGYTKTVYGTGQVEAYSAAGVGHGILTREAETMAFFGL